MKKIMFILFGSIYLFCSTLFLIFVDTLVLKGVALETYHGYSDMFWCILVLAPAVLFITSIVINIVGENQKSKVFLRRLFWISPLICSVLLMILISVVFNDAQQYTRKKWDNRENRYIMYEELESRKSLIKMKDDEVYSLFGQGEDTNEPEVIKSIEKLKDEYEKIDIYNLGAMRDTINFNSRGYLLVCFDKNNTVERFEIVEIEIDMTDS